MVHDDILEMSRGPTMVRQFVLQIHHGSAGDSVFLPDSGMPLARPNEYVKERAVRVRQLQREALSHFNYFTPVIAVILLAGQCTSVKNY